MEEKILNQLKEEIIKLEVQCIILEETCKILEVVNIKGAQAEEYAKQKMMLESSININRLLVANLKDKIKKEDEKNG